MFNNEMDIMDEMDLIMSDMGINEALKNSGKHSCRFCIRNITEMQYNKYNGCCSEFHEEELERIHR